MEYRIHPRTGEKISVIGIGTGPIFEAPEQTAVATFTYAYEHGVNYLDFSHCRGQDLSLCGGGFEFRAERPVLSNPLWSQL